MCMVCWLLERAFSCTCWIEEWATTTPPPRDRINISPLGGFGRGRVCVVQGHIIWDQLGLFDRAKVQRREKKGARCKMNTFFLFFSKYPPTPPPLHLPPPLHVFYFRVSPCVFWFWSFPRACQSVYSRCSKETHHHGSQFSSLFFHPHTLGSYRCLCVFYIVLCGLLCGLVTPS
jgi:hypothetical protein